MPEFGVVASVVRPDVLLVAFGGETGVLLETQAAEGDIGGPHAKRPGHLQTTIVRGECMYGDAYIYIICKEVY